MVARGVIFGLWWLGWWASASVVSPAAAQSLEERLDEEAFLRGLIDLRLPEVLDHYVAANPPADAGRAARYRIAADRMRLAALDYGSAERADVLERILEVRDELLAASPDHPQRALWLADQAADLYFELLPVDASGLTTVFGVPSASQRERALRVATEMDALTGEAELAIQQAVLELESRPGYLESQAMQMQRRQLATDERDRRIPFLRGVAVFLRAEVHEPEPAARRALYEDAIDRLAPIADRLSGLTRTRARLTIGLAAARLGRHDEATAVLDVVATDDQTSAPDAFAARLGGAVNAWLERGLSAGVARLDQLATRYQRPGDVFYRMLIADQRYLMFRAGARGARGSARRAALDEAFAGWLTLLTRDDEARRGGVRARILQRLADVAEGELLAELPAIVAIARGEQLARTADGRAEAIRILERAIARSDAGAAERAAGLFALGTALREAGRPHVAAERYLELARDHASSPSAVRAIELAASIAVTLHRRTPRDPDVQKLAGEALAVLFRQYPDLPTVGRWRYMAARVAIRERDFAAALTHLATIVPDADEYVDARFMIVNARYALAKQSSAPAETRASYEVVAAEAARSIDTIEAALAQREPSATDGRADDLGYYLDHLRAFHADALLALDEPSAAVVAAAPLGDDADRAALATGLRVRIKAYQALGRPDDARREIDAVLVAAPDTAGDVLDSMLTGVLAEVEALAEDLREADAVAKAEREAVPLADVIVRWLATARLDDARRTALTRRVAEAYRLAGRFGDGLRLYDRLFKANPNTVEILFGRAECLYGTGKHADAIAIYKRIAAGGPRIGRVHYWQSSLRILEILDAVQRNTDRIVPRIKQLRIADEHLGGERFRRGFQRLEGKYAGSG